MKGSNTWSYAPYRPLLFDTGDPYLCRVAPKETSVRLEWLSKEPGPFQIFYRLRNEGDFVPAGSTEECFFVVEDLLPDTEYEFFVRRGERNSRVRLARCGNCVGTVVNYLHPEDRAYGFSGQYLCSPSMVRHPEGFLLASMDVYQANAPQNLTLIFRSDDEGRTWHYLSELMPCFWGRLFVHRGELYMLACSTEYGDLLIGKSSDGGKSFCAPVSLLRGSGGKNGAEGVHKNPQPPVCYNGRLWGTLEWGAWANKEYCHAAMVMSCDENADLLDPASWHFTAPLPFDRFAPELEELPLCTMTIEGTLVVAPDGRLLNVMRFGRYGKALAYEVNLKDPDAPLTYSHCIDFPANLSKFTMRYDPVSGRYYSVATRLYDPERPKARNLLSLMSSPDLLHWEVVCDLYDYREDDPRLIGFQYVDFWMEGEDILFLCRTAMNGANSYHNSNYSTFDRIKGFRGL